MSHFRVSWEDNEHVFFFETFAVMNSFAKDLDRLAFGIVTVCILVLN